jgi:hypothetical protein
MPRIVPLKYSGVRRNEYETAKIFYERDRAGLRAVVEDLNQREKKARKQAERRAKIAAEKAAAAEIAAAEARKAKIAAEIAASEAKRVARLQKQSEKRKAERAAKKQKKAVAWENLNDWIDKYVGNKNAPFRLRLQSTQPLISIALRLRSVEKMIESLPSYFTTSPPAPTLQFPPMPSNFSLFLLVSTDEK